MQSELPPFAKIGLFLRIWDIFHIRILSMDIFGRFILSMEMENGEEVRPDRPRER
jgi:hypothetical protein